MKRNRSQAMVCRDGKLLLVEHRMKGRDFFNLPGGGIEENETPEEAALRELNEEAGVSGKIVRPLAIECCKEIYYRAAEVDPELSESEQTIVGVTWRTLEEIAERDRAYLFGAGLMRVPEFHDEVLKWPDDAISYPE